MRPCDGNIRAILPRYRTTHRPHRLCPREVGSRTLSIVSMSDANFVDWCYRQILRREADESGRHHYVQALERGQSRLELVEELFTSAEYEDRFAACRIFPPGYPLSPLPSGTDIEQHRAFDFHPPDVPAVDLRMADQWQLLQRLATHYPRLTFSALP